MAAVDGYLDQDTTDEFLDGPSPVYEDGAGKSGEELDQLLDPEYRRKHGLGPLPKLPPLTDH